MAGRSRTIKIIGFPATVSANVVKGFLENHTGEEGTVIALKVRPPKNVGPRSGAFVIVQFTTSRFAEEITFKAQQKLLRFGATYLTVKDGERDIIPKPRITWFNLEHTVLHIGCQVSDDKFSTLWNAADVEVNFGFGLRKLSFFFSNQGLEYKLELFYESIWQIQLRRPRKRSKKFLLIQVQDLKLVLSVIFSASVFPSVYVLGENCFHDWHAYIHFLCLQVLQCSILFFFRQLLVGSLAFIHVL